MVRTTVPRPKNVGSRIKVKTGCTTCRTRKVKCDEEKPFCHKCVSTGRTCDGYETIFRNSTSQSSSIARAGRKIPDDGSPPHHPTSLEVNLENIELLNRYFSTKTIHDVTLDCDEEARQVLQASRTDPSVRHAVSSLRALREDLETSGDNRGLNIQQDSSYQYGLKQYCLALNGLACNLSSMSSNSLRSALLCCQVFISIEQVQMNYSAMAQHMIKGLGILHESRARPGLSATNTFVPARNDQVPLLDVFVIKLFASPCKFADSSTPVAVDLNGSTSACASNGSDPHRLEPRNMRSIAPDMRKQLTKIATTTLEFLGRVLKADQRDIMFQLLSEKAALLESLDSWLTSLTQVQMEIGFSGLQSIQVSFMRIFHRILRIVLFYALDSSKNLNINLQTEINQLQDMAKDVGERVKDYMTRIGTRNLVGERSIVS